MSDAIRPDADDRIFDNTDTATGDGPIAQVREGMQVVDSASEHVGKVTAVQMGDPGAATVDSDTPDRGGFLGDIARLFGGGDEPDLPETLRARLMRSGFIKVDESILSTSDRYIAANQIAEVTGDTVRLNVTRDRIRDEQ